MLLVNSMDKWVAELTPIGQKLGSVSTKRSRYQRDFLPSAIFVLAIIRILFTLKDIKSGYQLGDLREKLTFFSWMN